MYDIISSVIQKRKLFKVNSEQSILECAQLMNEHHIGALPVEDLESQKIIGIISEKDITRKIVALGKQANSCRAIDIAYKDITFLAQNETIEKAMEIITKTKRRHILITKDNKIISLLSIGDIMKHVLEGKNQVIEQLENYIHL